MSRELRAFEGRVNSAEQLAAVLKLRDEAGVLIERLYAFAHLRHDENTDDQQAQGDYNVANDVANQFGEDTAWFVPALLALPAGAVSNWIESSPPLGVYRHWWADIERRRPHFRNSAEETLLAQVSPLSDGPSHTFSLFTNADMKFPIIRDEEGKEVELSLGRYMAAIYSQDRRYRKDAFLALHETYAKFANTLASLLNTQVKRDMFYAKARGYADAREAALGPNNIPAAVYDGLVGVVNRNLPLLHRYTELRRRVLKLDGLHAYDLYVSLVPESSEKVPYDEAVGTILDGLAVLGPEYCGPMRTGFASRWVDVCETQNKRSGAYCMGTYLVHPYLLLNYADNANARSTVAHEMGHAMHTWFTQHSQPPIYGDYTIFCAEVASTVNEALLNDHLLRRATTDEARLQLINQSLENIRTTVFRQTLFAEFERRIHDMAQQGLPLTSQSLFGEYRGLYERYYGPALVIDDVLDAECLRIPHFYRNFYVYQYATSYCAATDIARRILANGPGAVDGLIRFLKAGSSDYSINILKLAGVDMTTAEPFEATMRLFEKQLDEMEKLLKRVGVWR